MVMQHETSGKYRKIVSKKAQKFAQTTSRINTTTNRDILLHPYRQAIKETDTINSSKSIPGSELTKPSKESKDHKVGKKISLESFSKKPKILLQAEEHWKSYKETFEESYEPEEIDINERQISIDFVTSRLKIKSRPSAFTKKTVGLDRKLGFDSGHKLEDNKPSADITKDNVTNLKHILQNKIKQKQETEYKATVDKEEKCKSTETFQIYRRRYDLSSSSESIRNRPTVSSHRKYTPRGLPTKTSYKSLSPKSSSESNLIPQIDKEEKVKPRRKKRQKILSDKTKDRLRYECDLDSEMSLSFQAPKTLTFAPKLLKPVFGSLRPRDTTQGMHPKFQIGREQRANTAIGPASYPVYEKPRKYFSKWKEESIAYGLLKEAVEEKMRKLKLLERNIKTIDEAHIRGHLKELQPKPPKPRYMRMNPCRFANTPEPAGPGPAIYSNIDKIGKKSFAKTPGVMDFSKCQRFEQDCRRGLPPNLYQRGAVYKSIAETVSKPSQGKKGPYQLFTGPRNEQTFYGYLRALHPYTVKKEKQVIMVEDEESPDLFYYYEVPEEIPEMYVPESEIGRLDKRPNYGKWPSMKYSKRFPIISSGMQRYRQSGWIEPKVPKVHWMNFSWTWLKASPIITPGPGHYKVKLPKCRMRIASRPAFGQSIKYGHPPLRYSIRPGPTWYHIKRKQIYPNINAHTSVFKSNSPRTVFVPPKSYHW